MDMSYFNYCQGLTMTSQKFHDLFGGPPHKPDTLLTEREMDIAASIQKVTEEVMLRMARHVRAQTKMTNLCLAGGVALNCVANQRILEDGSFKNVWIQPAAGDAGGALGTALFIWHQLLGKPRTPLQDDSQQRSLLGPDFSDEYIKNFLDSVHATYTHIGSPEALCEQVAEDIACGKVIGWFQGRMEFGPRALGSRSIIGDARNPYMQTVMNMKVKFREGFRPFAPAVLRERAHEYFSVQPNHDRPYMLLVAPVKMEKREKVGPEELRVRGIDKLKIRRSTIPAVTHVDYSARIQTVDQRHGLYHSLIKAFDRKTACPVIINTSFNLGWDPIVCTPRDAYQTFMSSDIDVLCMGPYVLHKTAQRAWVSTEARKAPDAVLKDLWCSPCCSSELIFSNGSVTCHHCGHRFPIEDGIPLLFWPHDTIGDPGDVTEKVKAFYEETPFPNYDDHDSVRSLVEKSRRGIYAKMLNEAIPYNSTVLEVGCGTGQLTNFLGISFRTVVGADICLNSLRLGQDFRQNHGLDRVRFTQMNLFRPCFKPEQFDVILCNGVLHHTSDPYRGFRSLLPLLRPGGYIIIGLYNRWGRVLLDLRRVVFQLTRGRGKWLDTHLRSSTLSEAKRRAWFADQYCHPHESRHTIGEVLEWFAESGLKFVRGIPSVLAFDYSSNGNLFQFMRPGTKVDHFLAQTRQIIGGSREGGFFLMIGQKAATLEAVRPAAKSALRGNGQ
jgi:SAM-dependent methyltransferase/uncharacterized protein YbaR (Trm112 family)